MHANRPTTADAIITVQAKLPKSLLFLPATHIRVGDRISLERGIPSDYSPPVLKVRYWRSPKGRTTKCLFDGGEANFFPGVFVYILRKSPDITIPIQLPLLTEKRSPWRA